MSDKEFLKEENICVNIKSRQTKLYAVKLLSKYRIAGPLQGKEKDVIGKVSTEASKISANVLCPKLNGRDTSIYFTTLLCPIYCGMCNIK